MAHVNAKYLNQREAAEHLGCSLSTINKMVKRKLLPFSKVGRRFFIKIDDLEAALVQLGRRGIPKIHFQSGTPPKAKLSTLASRE